MNKILLVMTLLPLLSCTRLNVESQNYYREKKLRHGVVPLSSSVSQKFAASSVIRGRDLYTKHCLTCHGQDGLGDGPEASNQKNPPANLKKLVKEVPRFKFFMSVSQWQGDMPGWKEPFNEADREDLVAYIKTFK